MANSDRPNGAVLVGTLNGGPLNGGVRTYPVDSSNGTAIFRGDFVTLETDGNITPTAAASGIILGVVVGIEVDRSIAATEHPGYLPASTAGNVMVCVAPEAIYEIQESGNFASKAALVGSNVDILAGSGSTTGGFSAHEINSGTAAVSTAAQLRIIDVVDRADNDSTVANAKFLVQIQTGHFTTATGV